MEAMFQHSENGVQVCDICPRNCRLKEGQTGFCRVRKNIGGSISLLVYGKASAFNIDPIEKKPLFHFFPGEKVFSFGTLGCNIRCRFCQNWEISDLGAGSGMPRQALGTDLSPEEIVKLSIENDCRMIAATYNEPTIFYEYMLDTFKLAKEKGLKTVVVSNGFVNHEPLKELIKHADSFNIDLKSIEDSFYRKITSSWVGPVLDTIREIYSSGKHLEVTNLVIPGRNDSDEQLRNLCKFVASVGKEIPIHFSAFYPTHKLLDAPPTSREILDRAYKIAREEGLFYVYQGNIRGKENTICPKCGETIIQRHGYMITKDKIKNGSCLCGEKIYGAFAGS